MSEDLVSILDGNTFVVCDGRGDIEGSPSTPTGLFSLDTRYLSRWVLTMDGHRLNRLSVDDLQYYETRFFLVPAMANNHGDAKVSVIRQREIGGSFRERITVLNHGEQTLRCSLRLEAGADFADLFEIKDEVLNKKGEYYAQAEPELLRLGDHREDYRRETLISSTEPAQLDERGLSFEVEVEVGGSWATELLVRTTAVGPGGRDLRMGVLSHGPERMALQHDLQRWLAAAPKMSCECDALSRAYDRSLADLAALRFSPLSLPGQALPAAGLPWFMTMFGRDSIFTCLQTLAFTPELAPATLRSLATTGHGAHLDDFREEEPGKILHEMRYGESAAFEETPCSPYFGAADSTCLFVILLDEYERWSGDTALVRELEFEAREALRWIDEYADLMGNGYVWYERRNTRNGLENQCWKDSWDSISYHDGRLPGFPRATCELQGYAYDAKVRGARLARLVWGDPVWADRLEVEAAALKERFNRDFWVADGEYYAIALDAEGGQVDSLSSNIGHLLWSGIVTPERAAAVAGHLMSDRLFSGWGIRTLAVGEGRYNPIGYHTGTVWPFDNSFIAWGLRRYGFVEEAARVAEAVLDAAGYFRGRLPTAIAGYDRQLTRYPVQHPQSCSPQAWSSGAPLLLISTMLGLEPHEGHLAVDPALPTTLGRIELLDIPGRWGRVDAFARGRVPVRT